MLYHLALFFLKPILCMIVKTCCFARARRRAAKSLPLDFSGLATHYAAPKQPMPQYNKPFLLPKEALCPGILKPWCLHVLCPLPGTPLFAPLCSPPHLYLPSFKQRTLTTEKGTHTK